MNRRAALAVCCLGGSLFYILLGNFDSLLSQAVLAGLVLLLLPSMWRYMRRVAGREIPELAAQALAIWGLTWLLEKAMLGRIVLGWSYSYNGSHPLSWGPAGIPILIPTVWLVFGWIEDAVISGIKDRAPGGTGPRHASRLGLDCLAGGWILVSIDTAFEWHFSKAAAFWKWEKTPEAFASVAGVPLWNFGLWFVVGAAVVLTGRLFRARSRDEARRAGPVWLRMAPIAGLGFLLSAGIAMNLAYGAREGAFLCVLSLVALACAWAWTMRRGRHRDRRSSGDGAGRAPVSPRVPRSTPL
jgi:uncharacterized membrane protein